MEVIKNKFAKHMIELQDQITQKMHSLDESLSLKEDRWNRLDFNQEPGGGGITRAFSGGLFENAGVNTSEIYGVVDPKFAQNLKGSGTEVWATGLSLIIHPINPRVPTVHANFRMIHQGDKCWFGGGADLTPFYPHTEDFKYFHKSWSDACQKYDSYSWMKKKCDEYFVNTHRDNEMRGIGGIFFDHYNTGDIEKDCDMVIDLSNHFIDSYFPIVEKRMNEEFCDFDEDFQLHRRGRYVEFNLLHDRGTHFGLKSNGRTDSILISLPARCKYSYQYKPEENSIHSEMNNYYYPRDWI